MLKEKINKCIKMFKDASKSGKEVLIFICVWYLAAAASIIAGTIQFFPVIFYPNFSVFGSLSWISCVITLALFFSVPGQRLLGPDWNTPEGQKAMERERKTIRLAVIMLCVTVFFILLAALFRGV